MCEAQTLAFKQASAPNRMFLEKVAERPRSFAGPERDSCAVDAERAPGEGRLIDDRKIAASRETRLDPAPANIAVLTDTTTRARPMLCSTLARSWTDLGGMHDAQRREP